MVIVTCCLTALFVGIIVGYWASTTLVSVSLVTANRMRKILPYLGRKTRIKWENTAHDLVAISRHMTRENDVFKALQIDEEAFKLEIANLAKFKPRNNVEDIVFISQALTKMEIALLAADFATKYSDLYKSVTTTYAN